MKKILCLIIVLTFFLTNVSTIHGGTSPIIPSVKIREVNIHGKKVIVRLKTQRVKKLIIKIDGKKCAIKKNLLKKFHTMRSVNGSFSISKRLKKGKHKITVIAISKSNIKKRSHKIIKT